jgi:hypothetical protein
MVRSRINAVVVDEVRNDLGPIDAGAAARRHLELAQSVGKRLVA